MDDAQEQVCAENGVPIAGFNAFHLLVFLSMDRGSRTARRRIARVYGSDGPSPHTLVFDASTRTNGLPDDSWVARCWAFLDETFQTGVRTIEQARERVVAFLSKP
jgi:hypothetical protein